MIATTEPTQSETAYDAADRAVAHYLRLLAGSLSARERRQARILLIRAVFARGKARAAMELE